MTALVLALPSWAPIALVVVLAVLWLLMVLAALGLGRAAAAADEHSDRAAAERRARLERAS